MNVTIQPDLNFTLNNANIRKAWRSMGGTGELTAESFNALEHGAKENKLIIRAALDQLKIESIKDGVQYSWIPERWREKASNGYKWVTEKYTTTARNWFKVGAGAVAGIALMKILGSIFASKEKQEKPREED